MRQKNSVIQDRNSRNGPFIKNQSFFQKLKKIRVRQNQKCNLSKSCRASKSWFRSKASLGFCLTFYDMKSVPSSMTKSLLIFFACGTKARNSMFFPNEKTRQEDGNLLRKEGRVVKSYYAEVNRHLEKRKCQKKTVKGFFFLPSKVFCVLFF